MSCQVIRNTDTNEIEKVLAPNGKESMLYKDINKYITSKEEALLAYAQIYTPSFKEWFGDWEGKEESKSDLLLNAYNNVDISNAEKDDYKIVINDNLYLDNSEGKDSYYGYWMPIMSDGEDIGRIRFEQKLNVIEKEGKPVKTFSPNIQIYDKSNQGKGIGSKVHLALYKYVKSIHPNVPFVSDVQNTVAEMALLKSFEREGIVKQINPIGEISEKYGNYSVENAPFIFNDEYFKKETKETSGISQVVDENGEPKLVFHWSPEVNIDTFNLEGIGSHFGTYEAADQVNENKNGGVITYTDQETGFTETFTIPSEDGKFYPAFLNLKNLVEIEDLGQHTAEKDGKQAQGLINQGYDGFFYTNQYEDKGSTSYVATKKNQIKSLYNKGKFSKKSDNIYANITQASVDTNDPITSNAIKQLEDDNLITKSGEAFNNFIINNYVAEDVNRIESLLESNNIEYKRMIDRIKIYGLPQYEYKYNALEQQEEDEINNIKDLKKELGITGETLSYSEYSDISKSLKAYNEQNDKNYILIADQNDLGGITIKTIVDNKTLNRSTLDITQELMDRLQALFPDTEVRYINQNQISEFSNGRFSNTDETLNSFVNNGVVYLIKNKITGDIVVEEFLHPFVSAMMSDNTELAESLLSEIQERFPDITKLVEETYTDDKGFTDEDRKNEIITKGLQRALSERLYNSFKTKDKTIKSLVETFLDWVKNLIRKITGRKKLYVGEISTKMSVDNIINMLDSNIQVRFGKLDPNFYANLSQEKVDILNYVLKNATAEQKYVVETLFDNGIIHNEVDHTYEKVVFDEDGTIEEVIDYTSMTTAMKGPFTDTAYELNRDIGTEFDFIMNSIVMGEDFDSIKAQLKVISEDTAAKFYNHLNGYISGVKSTGAIIVPQVVLGADVDKIAGKMDLLIVEQDGTMRITDLKTSATQDIRNNPKKYDQKYEVQNEESMLYGERLSTRDYHGIQQHGYKRMIELDGRLTDYEVASVKTLHYRFKIEDGQAVEVYPDQEVDHTATVYDDSLEKIIATPALDRTKGFSSSLSAEQAKPENKEVVAELRDLIKDSVKTLEKRRDLYKKLNETSKGKLVVSKQQLDALDDIISTLNENIVSGKPTSAFYALIKYINADVKDKARMLGKMQDRSENLQFMLETEKDLKTYQQLLQYPKLFLKNKTITDLSKDSQNHIYETLNLINIELENYTVDFITNNTSRDLTREEIEGIIKEAEDIDWHSALFGDLSTSSDVLLSVLDKVYKSKRQEIIDFVQKLELEIKTAGNKLAALSDDKEKMYDYMVALDDEGNPTGYTVDRVGKKYWSKRREIREKLIDSETKLRYKYKHITNLKSASEKDIKFNLELKKAKEEESEFNKKEYLNDKGEVVDGPYHKYTDEFKEARSKVMRIKYKKNAEGEIVGYEWIPKKADSKEFIEFERKYYNTETTFLKPIYEYDKSTKTYVFKGRTEEGIGKFVKSDYTEVRDIAENGEDMRDEKYVKIMEDNTELGIARREYYETWKRLYGELLTKLPNGVKMRTRIPVVAANMMQQAKRMGGGSNYYKGILKGVGRTINPFDKTTFHHSVILDENGDVVSNIPVFYVSDLQSEYSIKSIKDKITKLNERWAKKSPDDEGKVISYDEYRNQLSKLTKSLKIEKSKTPAKNLSKEMTVNLVQFAEMAENFQVMTEFESTVISVLRSIRSRRVTKKDADGNFITNSVDKAVAKFKGEESLAETRLLKWMEMVLYNTKNPYRSRVGNFVKKVQLWMSIKGVGLNPFGQLNNLKMGNINNMAEAAGGTIYNKKDYGKAIKSYTTDYLPAFLAARKDYVFKKGKDKNGEFYELPKSFSKYDALVSKYRMMRAMQSKDGIEGYEGKTIDFLFMLQHGTEFSIQSKSGMAILNNRTLTNKITGEKISIYDAHSFDEKTGKAYLDPNLYDETDADRYELTNIIYETNKRIHGNYAWEDRMVIQQHLLGEMVAQFHKWVYPWVRRWWGKNYNDENFGETEGMLTSLFKLNRAIYDMTKLEGGFWKGITKKQTFTEAWNTMSDYQKSNMSRLLAYMAFFLLSLIMKHIWKLLADELEDEEEPNTALVKLVNFMVYLDDRTMDEITVAFNPEAIGQFVKNPIAIVGFIGDAWDALSETFNYFAPWVPEEKTIFQRGVNKGEYKWTKEWGDIIPFFSAINKWDSFEELQEFYIK